MYLSKKNIKTLDDVLDRLNADIKLAGIVGVRRELKDLYFRVDEIRERAIKENEYTAAHTKQARFFKPIPPNRFCCVCKHRRDEKIMRRLSAEEVGKLGRADQWVCQSTHKARPTVPSGRSNY